MPSTSTRIPAVKLTASLSATDTVLYRNEKTQQIHISRNPGESTNSLTNVALHTFYSKGQQLQLRSWCFLSDFGDPQTTFMHRLPGDINNALHSSPIFFTLENPDGYLNHAPCSTFCDLWKQEETRLTNENRMAMMRDSTLRLRDPTSETLQKDQTQKEHKSKFQQTHEQHEQHEQHEHNEHNEHTENRDLIDLNEQDDQDENYHNDSDTDPEHEHDNNASHVSDDESVSDEEYLHDP